MAILLDVPIFAQTSQMSCWWAAMKMILWYHKSEVSLPSDLNNLFLEPADDPAWWTNPTPPIPPAPGVAADFPPHDWYARGVPPYRLPRLAELTGFRTLGSRPASWSESNLDPILREKGPLFFYGVWNGSPHAIVVTGVDQVSVFFNDPNGPVFGRDTLAWLNTRMVQSFRTTANPLYCPRGRFAVKQLMFRFTGPQRIRV